MMNFNWGWMLFGGFLIIVFWVAIVALTVWAVSRLFRTGPSSGAEREFNALEIAKRRYARGEITKEQFEQLKKDLS